jgi:hypothetical protein
MTVLLGTQVAGQDSLEQFGCQRVVRVFHDRIYCFARRQFVGDHTD